jgi:hypothetical protein
MAESKGDGKKPSGSAGAAAGGDAQRSVLAQVRTWVPAFTGFMALIGAVAAFAQPYVRSGVALVGVCCAAVAGLLLLMLGIAVILKYWRRPVAVKARAWVVALAGLLLLTAGAGLGVALAGGPSSSGGGTALPTTTPSAAVSLAAASCQADAALTQARSELGSNQTATRLSAISTVEQIMDATPSQQCAAISALSSFIRTASPATNDDQPVTPDIQAALTVLVNRNPAHDGGATIDLENANMTGANLAHADFAHADFSGSTGADFTDANLTDANLSDADLDYAYLGGATLTGTDLAGASLQGASFYSTELCTASNTPTEPNEGYTCQP